tara:strand:- start:12 stop:302 length:291 start_codon:yes stop_codon:yes gene_type:complete
MDKEMFPVVLVQEDQVVAVEVVVVQVLLKEVVTHLQLVPLKEVMVERVEPLVVLIHNLLIMVQVEVEVQLAQEEMLEQVQLVLVEQEFQQIYQVRL